MAASLQIPRDGLLNGREADTFRQRLLCIAAFAEAGDTASFMDLSPEEYRRDHCLTALSLKAARFCPYTGAAYVLVTGQTFTKVSLLAYGIKIIAKHSLLCADHPHQLKATVA